MLNKIQFHIDENEQKQQQIEMEAAKLIQRRNHEGVEAFKRYIPNLLPSLTSNRSRSATVFCNRLGNINIIDYLSGNVLYGLNPEQESKNHIKEAISRSSIIDVSGGGVCLQSADLLVILGLGLGYYLSDLIEGRKYKYIVIYEPNEDYFASSLSAINWKSILRKANEFNIALFLQIGKDASELYNNVEELNQNLAVQGMVIYKHLNSPLFDNLERFLRSHKWEEMASWVPNRSIKSSLVDYVPPWTLHIESGSWSDQYLDHSKKKENLAALAKYFPDLYKEFLNYIPRIWMPVANESGETNLCYESTGALFYDYSPSQDGKDSFSLFEQHPNKDGLILGYKGIKLRNYLHYRLVSECESIMSGLDEVKGTLPTSVRSLIFFGLGAGYSLNELIDNHSVDKLFICEPNKDFFYASLFTVNWDEILHCFDDGDKRLYLNVGDDGTNLTDDLLVQFQSVGPYVLANTYFYQGYYNERLVAAISQMREQLQVIIAMGDYFDNAKYGLAHTRVAIERETPFLLNNASSKISAGLKEVPIFIVGNGPSLDNLLDVLKSEKDNVVIISCGTALQSLHRNGITPDFHAEIEMNRATHDWATRIQDSEYLQKIRLISCNGVHPDTMRLYGSTLLAFKQGEASTVACAELHNQKMFAHLNHAYPTVSNFVVDLITTLGFQQIYLFGIDLGFKDPNYHHSKMSGYYQDNGQELYDYAGRNNTSILVPGNLRPWVNSKFEFKVSKAVIEQSLISTHSSVYNLSDGAKINGAIGLKSDDVLVLSTAELKKELIDTISLTAFAPVDREEFNQQFSKRFSNESLSEELLSLLHLLKQELKTREDIDQVISQQRDLLVSSLFRKKSILFFLLNGTLNYINSVLSKLLNIGDDDLLIEVGTTIVGSWGRYLEDIMSVMGNDEIGLDGSGSFYGLRRNIYLKTLSESHSIEINISPSSKIHALEKWCDIQKIKLSEIYGLEGRRIEFGIPTVELDQDAIYIVNSLSSLLPNKSKSRKVLLSLACVNPDVGISIIPPEFDQIHHSVNALYSAIEDFIVIPKLIVYQNNRVDGLKAVTEALQHYTVYETQDFLLLTPELLREDALILAFGDRLSYRPRLTEELLVVRVKTEKEFVSVSAQKRQ
ncbi:6-hydroxymethylpterin diphosphokinase MptE-like protein [Alteromonas sp. CI.11.F.A3]|uniref:motility associated factor glycosyltransferase family protein n=1 Tax=Alteromonas sp. CI.11.F.A3 TaxID=3079555 RepID=UPI00294204EA|nr:6-hydroxymethylpterin diphosphokinase MptE-like protein [Alteromonas sp. CI.11.F.A3]WOI36651.1 6-hydroxymethylpterin diphosphokinase MptE-like protein [Alteromonas sp. CI.11.F.A3]